MHSCQPRLAFRCNRPLLQQNNLRLLLLHKKPQTYKPIFQQNHSDLIPGVEPPLNLQRKCKNFRIAKMATLTASSFFTETNHLKLLLRKKQVPQVPSSQKTKCPNLNSGASWSAAAAAAAARTENAEMRWRFSGSLAIQRTKWTNDKQSQEPRTTPRSLKA